MREPAEKLLMINVDYRRQVPKLDKQSPEKVDSLAENKDASSDRKEATVLNTAQTCSLGHPYLLVGCGLDARPGLRLNFLWPEYRIEKRQL